MGISEGMAEDQTISPINGFIHNPITTGSSTNPAAAPAIKKKRNLPGTPDPDAEVIALSPKTLMATNRFLCEICGKGFQRDQNLQLHRRGHNLPWKLKQRSSKEPRKRVYVCPEKSCVHHHPSRALGDLTGIKKHFCRKHGEKKWKCEKCSKRYAVQSDWKAHSKTCGTREYRCDCGTLFSRRDSFITHRAFCDALAEETARVNAASSMLNPPTTVAYPFMGSSLCPTLISSQNFSSIFKPISTSADLTNAMEQTRPTGLSLWMDQPPSQAHHEPNWLDQIHRLSSSNVPPLMSSCSNPPPLNQGYHLSQLLSVPSLYSTQQHIAPQAPNMSATALLQKAAQIGAATSTTTGSELSFVVSGLGSKFDSNSMGSQFQDCGDNNKFSGLYGPSNSTLTSLGSDQSVLESSSNGICTLTTLPIYPPAKRRNTQMEANSAGGGQTRDFLGVGVHTICNTSTING
ncbi:zinc finger protein MAGPIE [Punica granatum]|uniref:Zinc finger protein MAGPIE n=1 Tax=Punica granatum TaxID=22663 RepID=A0A6P8CAG1_PUNGR|nr:zinc finger protein MAGPIE [Punica granatum]